MAPKGCGILLQRRDGWLIGLFFSAPPENSRHTIGGQCTQNIGLGSEILGA